MERIALFESVEKHHDKDEGLRIRAGIDDLNKHSVTAEMLQLSELSNCTWDQVWHLDDQTATFVLLYRKEYSNFEKRFSELKMNEIKRK